jgi:CheY-like chemotaxis protein
MLLTIINDVLDFSKIDAGKLDLDLIPFRLRDCVARIMKPLTYRADGKGLKLVWSIDPDVPDQIVADPTRLSQIIINLVSNAIKFTNAGKVTLRVLLLSTEASENGRATLTFSVADTGIGIPLEKQKSIFEAFTQASAGSSRQFGGTGLGLTISTQLVGLMGGKIWVESSPGAGSCFHFSVSVGLAQIDRKAVPMPIANLGGLSVLIADNNAASRRALVQMLKAEGMATVEAGSSVEALQKWRASTEAGAAFSVLLVCADTPDIDGFAFLDELRKIEPLSKTAPAKATATVMLTSAGQRGDAARCSKLGVAAFLTKPVSQMELVAAIRMALDPDSATASHPELITRYSLPANSPGLHILLADDNPVNQKVAARMLEKQNHVVTVVGSGREVLQVLERRTFDLILMDIQMPEMDGLEATAAIRENEHEGRRIPIIALTAHAMSGDKERCLAAGMDGYASKPISLPELTGEINRLCVLS